VIIRLERRIWAPPFLYCCRSYRVCSSSSRDFIALSQIQKTEVWACGKNEEAEGLFSQQLAPWLLYQPVSSLRIVVGDYWKKQKVIGCCHSSRPSVADSIPEPWSPGGAQTLLPAEAALQDAVNSCCAEGA